MYFKIPISNTPSAESSRSWGARYQLTVALVSHHVAYMKCRYGVIVRVSAPPSSQLITLPEIVFFPTISYQQHTSDRTFWWYNIPGILECVLHQHVVGCCSWNMCNKAQETEENMYIDGGCLRMKHGSCECKSYWLYQISVVARLTCYCVHVRVSHCL